MEAQPARPQVHRTQSCRGRGAGRSCCGSRQMVATPLRANVSGLDVQALHAQAGSGKSAMLEVKRPGPSPVFSGYFGHNYPKLSGVLTCHLGNKGFCHL